MNNSITVPITFLISMIGLASVFGMWAFFLFYKWNKTIKSCDEWEERYYKEYSRNKSQYISTQRMERSR